MSELAIKYNREEINSNIPYAVIVENWDKKNSGRGKREYNKEFTPTERKIIASYYNRMYKWFLVTGVPKSCTITVKNIAILQQAGNFFASI